MKKTLNFSFKVRKCYQKIPIFFNKITMFFKNIMPIYKMFYKTKRYNSVIFFVWSPFTEVFAIKLINRTANRSKPIR